MNPNPTFGAAPAGMNAKDALNVPSVLLLIAGGIGALFGLAGLVGGSSTQQMAAMLANDPKTAQYAHYLSGPTNIVGQLLALGISGFIIFGALKMRNLQSYGVALGAAIVAMIPCGGCCCIGLPVGIWALVLLLKPEVKSQFQA